jgi:hypothetical protein
MGEEIITIHSEESDYAKELNKIFPISKVIYKLNEWKIEDRIHWRDILITTILHNTSRTEQEALESLEKIKKAIIEAKSKEQEAFESLDKIKKMEAKSDGKQ